MSPLVAPARLRSAALDHWRGLAVLLMIVDHVCLVFATGEGVRLTLGRLAMPIFMVLGGHLAGKLRLRHAGILALGLALPLLVPWLATPNILVLWVAGVALLELGRRLGVPAWVLPVLALTFAANHGSIGSASFDPVALWGLMGLGALLPRVAFDSAARWPSWLAVIGRHPLAWYVLHLLLLNVIALVRFASWWSA